MTWMDVGLRIAPVENPALYTQAVDKQAAEWKVEEEVVLKYALQLYFERDWFY